ncbi:MAG: class I SAM-dependent methyltransferase [Caldilineaceae bacterium]
MSTEHVLANRLRKRQRHLRKWARRSEVSCYRLYERDIPEYPLIVDWYEGEAVVWLYERTRDETDAQAMAFQAQALIEIQEGLALKPAQIFVKERQRQQGNSQYERLAQSGQVRIVQEQGLRFEVNLSDYLDTGLFLDHRNTRARVRSEAQGQSVLNLFAYTGSFTCYALDGGARATTTVDLSQTYCDWARRNLSHNGFAESAEHRIVQADCLAFLAEERQRRARYDLIICDPPTFSNSKRMAQSSFDVVRDHPRLIVDCANLLDAGGVLYFSTNARRFALDERALQRNLQIEELTPQSLPEDFRNTHIHRCWRMAIG